MPRSAVANTSTKTSLLMIEQPGDRSIGHRATINAFAELGDNDRYTPVPEICRQAERHGLLAVLGALGFDDSV